MARAANKKITNEIPIIRTALANQNHSKYDATASHCNGYHPLEDSVQELLNCMWIEILCGERQPNVKTIVRRRLSHLPIDQQDECFQAISLQMMNEVRECLVGFQFAEIALDTPEIEIFLRIIRGERFRLINNTNAYFTTIIRNLIHNWITGNQASTEQLQQVDKHFFENLPDTNDEHDQTEENVTFEKMVRSFINEYNDPAQNENTNQAYRAMAVYRLKGYSNIEAARRAYKDFNPEHQTNTLHAQFPNRIQNFIIRRFGQDAVDDLFNR